MLWNSIQKNDVDFFRLLHLAAENPVVAKGFYYELANLTDAIDERDGDRASQLLTGHFSRILLLLPPVRTKKPDYFN